MEVETVTHAIQSLASQRDAQITYAIILTDSKQRWSLEWTALTGTQTCTVFGCEDFYGSTALGILVSGNEREGRLVSTADIACGLQLGRAEVLRGLRNILNMEGQGITALIA